MDTWLEAVVQLAPVDSFFSYKFNVTALVALFLVALVCGSTGSLVVGARMAFFSDALAHSAFAGVSIGFLLVLVFLAGEREAFWTWVTPVMLAFGMLVGFGIAWARERTGLTNDTVIGVFFAASTGLAAALRKLIQNRQLFTLEDFLFGDPLLSSPGDLVNLLILLLLVVGLLGWLYNPLMLGGFNASLAQSRQLPHRLASYAFIVLLALVVNLCVRVVGVMLINALLVVPAATAVNLGRNLREVFWWSVGLCLISCIGGLFLCWEIETCLSVKLGIPGTIVLVAVTLFALSVILSPWWKRRPEQTNRPFA
ncbi:MAG: metal ABC transporter permease [Gemmataceae bacterium]